MRLKRWTPRTAKVLSLALLTQAGEDWTIGALITFRPVLEVGVVKDKLYPSTRPWAIFQIKMMKYLSRLLS